METLDPLLEVEPDFLNDLFIQARADLTALNIPEDAIVNVLRQAWIANQQVRHNAWAEDCQRRQNEPRQDGPPQDEPPHDNEAPPQPDPIDGADAQPKAQKAKDFPSGVTVPDAKSPRPSEYARQKAAKAIELWYFSREGLAEASLPTTSTSNDTFGMVAGDSGAIQLCPVATTKASKNALPDESLSWDQVSFASKVYVDTLRRVGEWPDKHVRALINFFSELDYQWTRLTSVPDKVFVEYQATVRRQWMDSWDFDISQFSIPRLQAIQSRVTMHAHQAALVSDSLIHVPCADLLALSLLTPPTASQRARVFDPAAILQHGATPSQHRPLTHHCNVGSPGIPNVPHRNVAPVTKDIEKLGPFLELQFVGL